MQTTQMLIEPPQLGAKNRMMPFSMGYPYPFKVAYSMSLSTGNYPPLAFSYHRFTKSTAQHFFDRLRRSKALLLAMCD